MKTVEAEAPLNVFENFKKINFKEAYMFRKLNRNKRGQNTAEYAILISLVVAGVVAMQTYVTRALNARSYDGSKYMVAATTMNTEGTGITGSFNTLQYELTVEDPGAYTEPWSTGLLLRWNSAQELFEYVCQDNNLFPELMLVRPNTSDPRRIFP